MGRKKLTIRKNLDRKEAHDKKKLNMINENQVSKKQIDEQMRLWKEFVDRNKTKEFKLNPEKERVEGLARGVLNNENKKGLKFCPCRMISKDFEKDVKLICPCNFKTQTTWKEKGECWCSLFVKA